MPPIVLQHFYDHSSLQHLELSLYPKEYIKKLMPNVERHRLMLSNKIKCLFFSSFAGNGAL